MQKKRASALAVGLLLCGLGASQQAAAQAVHADTDKTHSLSTVEVSASQPDPDDVRPQTVSTATKTPLALKDIPQSVDTLQVNKYKNYGINDLSVMLEGVPGVSTGYDMRSDALVIRGFSADSGDIYRDGVRESGQVRHSTANIERIEILKGPASVLYGRSGGGGLINMVSKQARFDAVSSAMLRGGSWDNIGSTIDLNQVLNPNVAVRLTADYEQAHSFRSGIKNRNQMVSPSVLIDGHNGWRWTGQYTYDNVWRIPDRGPVYAEIPSGVSISQGFAQPGDFVEDHLQVLRSDLAYDINPAWNLRWIANWRNASQDFDHYYAGTYCNAQGRTPRNVACTSPGLLRQSYAWQQTANRTLSNTLDLSGKLKLGQTQHDLLVGLEHSEERRAPRLYFTANSNGYVDLAHPVFNAVRAPQGAPDQHNLHIGKGQALYAQDLISFNEQWKLLLGARYDSFDFRSTNRLNNASRSISGTSLSPRIGLVWQPRPEHSLYASWSKSFSPYGGRGLLSVDTSPNAVLDEASQYSRQYEAGVKSDWLQGTLSTQLAIYELEHYNIRYRPDPINAPFLFAVRGKERSRGIEFNLSGKLAAAWYVRGGLGIMAATVVENKFKRAQEGRLLPETARHNGNLFVRYAPTRHWYAELGMTGSGTRYLNETNTTRLPGYAHVDGLISWRHAPWTATLAVTNLLNREYWRSGAMPGTPRAALFSTNYQF